MLVAPEVRDALEEGRPVVALESTIITHGMPFPSNLETARAAEAEIRAAGAVPATIAVLDGKVQVGLSGPELERLAGAAGEARKCSLRDLPLAVADRGNGGTTVAATLHVAHRVGIRVFATGGIGGVHRGAETTLDISADLPQLARSPLAVVCAGPKAILDLGLTLEYLETHGVTVLGYGTNELPAFWSRDSGHTVDACVTAPGEVAAVLEARQALDLPGGVLVCQPIAAAHALAREDVEAAIESALQQARDRGIAGKQLTPFLLGEVMRATGGESLAANQALMAANARLAAEVAVALVSARPPGISC
jgi:pseudouridine-5'-phosphate glycosidase